MQYDAELANCGVVISIGHCLVKIPGNEWKDQDCSGQCRQDFQMMTIFFFFNFSNDQTMLMFLPHP